MTSDVSLEQFREGGGRRRRSGGEGEGVDRENKTAVKEELSLKSESYAAMAGFVLHFFLHRFDTIFSFAPFHIKKNILTSKNMVT